MSAFRCSSVSKRILRIGAIPPSAFSKMRRPADPTHPQHAGVENVSRSFRVHREPQQSTRFGPHRNNSFSRSKDGTFLMRLPSEPGCACAPLAATPLRSTRMGAALPGADFDRKESHVIDGTDPLRQMQVAAWILALIMKRPWPGGPPWSMLS